MMGCIFAYDLFYLWVYWPSFECFGNLLHFVDCTDSHNVVQTHYKLLTYILMSWIWLIFPDVSPNNEFAKRFTLLVDSSFSDTNSLVGAIVATHTPPRGRRRAPSPGSSSAWLLRRPPRSRQGRHPRRRASCNASLQRRVVRRYPLQLRKAPLPKGHQRKERRRPAFM